MPFDFLHKDAARLLTLPGLAVCASWGDETLTGVRSTMKRQDAATLNGDLVKYDFSLMVPASEVQRVGACPVPLRDLLVVDGVSHLVLAVDIDVAGNRRIHLGSQYG